MQISGELMKRLEKTAALRRLSVTEAIEEAVDAWVEAHCPIPGCSKPPFMSRGGWDTHVAAPERHPDWHPKVKDGEKRKQLSRRSLAWDDNGNGRISCAEAVAHGIAPVARDHPAYPFMRDGDGDGMVCESRSQRSVPAHAPAARDASGTGCGPFRNCTALRRVHPNGVRRGHCAYQRRMDRDNDGWACER